VSAAEIAAFVYCPEQWRLEYGQGLPPANPSVMDAGTWHHERKAVAERVDGRNGLYTHACQVGKMGKMKRVAGMCRLP
jgi:hypothetical protein